MTVTIARLNLCVANGLINMDPFYCSCSACRKFLKKYFKGYESLLNESEEERIKRTRIVSASLGKSGNKDSCSIRLGDRVVIRGNQTGFVKFVGPLSDSIGAELYIGVQLDENGIHCANFRLKLTDIFLRSWFSHERYY